MRIIRKKSTGEIFLRIGQELVGGPYASLQAAKRERNRRERNQAMRDLGLVSVRGALGGKYWE